MREQITIKQGELFVYDPQMRLLKIDAVNQSLLQLLQFKAKSAHLKYDIEVKLRKAVQKALEEVGEQNKNLLELHSKKTKVKIGSKEFDTPFKVLSKKEHEKNKAEAEAAAKEKGYEYQSIGNEVNIDGVNGKPTKNMIMLEGVYNLENKEAYQKELLAAMEVEVTLDCFKLRLSLLNNEDCSKLDFEALEKFIEDDIN